VNKDSLNKKIGQKIVELRTAKGWSQSDLAKACNKDRQGIDKLEKGKVNPTFYTLYEIAQALEVKLSDLIDFSWKQD
jgi:putative transcriptional regulator